ncbi:MAG TPA: hypothetical protein VF232_06030 [Gaiellaceae bacterium]
MTLFIVLSPVLLLWALNDRATAAVGLVAPGLQTIQLPGEGIVIDPNTHVPGLVAAKTPRSELRVRADPRAAAHVAELKADLREAHDARARASAAVGVILGLLALLAAVIRSRVLARAAVLYAPAAIALGLAWRSSLAIGFGALALALVAGVSRRAFVPLLVVVFAGALLVLWQWPVTNALATIGPHPDGGHRFYGVTNQVETMLLAPALAGGPVVAPLALIAVGWSKAGADGGGLVTYAAGYAMLALRRLGRITPRRMAVAVAVVLAGGVLLVALDATTGGSSHVTHAIGGGLPGDLAHRWRVSYDGATRNVGAFIMFASGVALLVLVALVRPRPPLVDAMLVALVVSFIVNDTPQDVALWGALGAISLLALERSRVR